MVSPDIAQNLFELFKMPLKLPVTGVVPISQMHGEDEQETALLEQMSQEARSFLLGFGWCTAIEDFFFGDGIGGIFAVFFARIAPSKPDIDEFLWLIVGDIPPAYLVTDLCHTPREAMSAYIEEMRRWVAAAKAGATLEDVIPVNVPAIPENAVMLEARLNKLEQDILPKWMAE
jgi:hypothetical protein